MTYNELIQNPEFEKISFVDYDGIKKFIFAEIKSNRGWRTVIAAYQIVGIILLLLVLITSIERLASRDENIYLVWTGIGVIFSFTFLILIHELIHMLAYRWIGVKQTSLGMNLRKFEFYVLADRVVLDYKQSMKVALAPAVLVAVVSLSGVFVFFNAPECYFFLSVFSIHSLFCVGDFGLLSFFQNRPEMEIYNFDVCEERKTYFYGRKRTAPAA